MESILEQTFSDYELIIIDDASETYVNDIISGYNDERIKYTRLSENGKICNALNIGISVSGGEYIAIMHSDDVSIRSRLEKESEILDKNQNVGLVNSYSVVQTPNNCGINRPYQDQDIEKLFLKYIGNNIVHPNVMIRKSVLAEHSIKYNPQFVFAEDYRMWIDIMPYCDFYTIPELLTLYNLNVNPSRQNHSYMGICRKVILLENYAEVLNLPKDKYSLFISKLWDNKFKYIDFMNLRKDVYEPMLEILATKLNKRYFCSFSNKLKKTIEDFNPYKKG